MTVKFMYENVAYCSTSRLYHIIGNFKIILKILNKLLCSAHLPTQLIPDIAFVVLQQVGLYNVRFKRTAIVSTLP